MLDSFTRSDPDHSPLICRWLFIGASEAVRPHLYSSGIPLFFSTPPTLRWVIHCHVCQRRAREALLGPLARGTPGLAGTQRQRKRCFTGKPCPWCYSNTSFPSDLMDPCRGGSDLRALGGRIYLKTSPTEGRSVLNGHPSSVTFVISITAPWLCSKLFHRIGNPDSFSSRPRGVYCDPFYRLCSSKIWYCRITSFLLP